MHLKDAKVGNVVMNKVTGKMYTVIGVDRTDFVIQDIEPEGEGFDLKNHNLTVDNEMLYTRVSFEHSPYDELFKIEDGQLVYNHLFPIEMGEIRADEILNILYHGNSCFFIGTLNGQKKVFMYEAVEDCFSVYIENADNLKRFGQNFLMSREEVIEEVGEGEFEDISKDKEFELSFYSLNMMGAVSYRTTNTEDPEILYEIDYDKYHKDGFIIKDNGKLYAGSIVIDAISAHFMLTPLSLPDIIGDYRVEYSEFKKSLVLYSDEVVAIIPIFPDPYNMVSPCTIEIIKSAAIIKDITGAAYFDRYVENGGDTVHFFFLKENLIYEVVKTSNSDRGDTYNVITRNVIPTR